MPISSNLGEINLGEFNLGELPVLVILELQIGDSWEGHYDEIEVNEPIYQGLLTLTIDDNLNEFNDLIDSITLVFEGDAITYEVGEAFYLNDSIELQLDYFSVIEDDLNSWDEGLEVMPADYLDYAYDTMMYDFLDAIALDLRLERGVSDSISLSDAVSNSYPTDLQTRTVVDSLTLSDAIALKLIGIFLFTEYIALHDFINLFLTQAVAVSDTLTMSDSVSAILSTQDRDINESLDLWNELVRVELDVRLEQVVADSMSQTDSTSNSGVVEDTTYYRRYLNDVRV